ncbi:MAG: hypothetical protein AAF414_23160 [Pseudomonadota bacterium]
MNRLAVIIGSALTLALVACDDNDSSDESAEGANESAEVAEDTTADDTIDAAEAETSSDADAAEDGSASGTIDVVVTGAELGPGDFCRVLISYTNNAGTGFDNVNFNIQYYSGDDLVGGAGCGMAGLADGANGEASCSASTNCDALDGVTYSAPPNFIQCNTEGADTSIEPCPDLITVTSEIGG